MKVFLDLLAEEILKHPHPHELTIIFPNKRPALFLEKKLVEISSKPLIAPAIYSITDFFSAITRMQPVEKYDLLLILFEAYVEIMQEAGLEEQSFEEFTGWGNALLKDFDEIDKFLINPSDLLKSLLEIKELEQWEMKTGSTHHEMNDYLKFFEQLPRLYNRFIEKLKINELAYDGMIYRRAWESKENWSKKIEEGSLILAGFNALSKVEKEIFHFLIKNNKAKIFYDADQCYLEEPFEAGLFLRKNRDDKVLGKDFQFIFDACHPPKSFYKVHAPDEMSQIQFVVDQVLQWEKEGKTDEEFRLKTLIVLADTSLLLPLLYALPPEAKEINISFSLPLKQMQVFQITDLFIKFFINAQKTGNVNVSDFIFLLNHPFFPGNKEEKEKTGELFIALRTKYLDTSFFFRQIQDTSFASLFKPVGDVRDILRLTAQFIEALRQTVPSKSPERLALVEMEKLVRRISTVVQEKNFFNNPVNWHKFFRRLASEIGIYLSGNPLRGYQIMGLLETRLLDFERIFVIGANEGILPSNRKGSGFIPYDLRKYHGLPVYDEQNAITAYHFYRLISRSSEVYLLFNTSVKGISGGEASRFIIQLEHILPRYGMQMKNIYLQDSNSVILPEDKIIKPAGYTERMTGVLQKKGISASMIISYLHYPEDFFLRYVLGWEETSQLEDYIAANRMGDVIHASMEFLYRNYINQILTPEIFNELEKQLNEEVEKQFYRVYIKSENNKIPLKGRNILALESAKEIVKKFISIDKAAMRNGGELIILDTERRVELQKEIPGIGPVKFKGFIDRIDKLNGQLRVVDYKTGKMDKKLHVKWKEGMDFREVFLKEDSKYLFQIYFYIWLLRNEIKNHPDGRLNSFTPVIYTARNREPVSGNPDLNNEEFWHFFEEGLFDVIQEMIHAENPLVLNNTKKQN